MGFEIGAAVRGGAAATAHLLASVAPSATTTSISTATTSTATTSTATTTPGSSSSGSVIHLGGSGQVVFVAIVIGIFAALWFSLIIYDRVTTTRWRNCAYTDLLKSILDDAKPPQGTALSAADVQELAKAVGRPPRGIQGLTRTLLALGLLTLVAVAMVSLFVGNGNNASELLKTVVTALTTALITIIGFYFGARTAESSDGGVKPAVKPTPATTRPQVTTQPIDQTVSVGDNATFRAASTGSPEPTVRWQESTSDPPTFFDIPGATSSVYTVVRPNQMRMGPISEPSSLTLRVSGQPTQPH